MQVSVETKGKLERELKIELPEDRIANEVQNRLKSLSKTKKIHGFRPGKVPFKVIESRFGEQVRHEVVGELVQSSFYEAINQKSLKPAGQPVIDPLSSEQGKGLSYTANFEVMPDLKLAPVDKLVIKKPVCEIGDDDFNKMTDVLRKQQQTFKETDRASQSGDSLVIDFDGEISGEPFEGGSSKDFNLVLGAGRFIEGFESGLIGKKVGEDVKLELKFPNDYANKDLAGKDVVFKVQIKQISEPVLPELNDKFFEAFGVKEGGIEAFKKEVMNNMNKEAENAIRTRVRDAVMDALYVANPNDLPSSLVHEEAHRLKHQFAEKLKSYGVKAGDSDQLTADESVFEEQAKKRVGLQLIIMEYIRQHELKANPAKVKRLVEKEAENYEDKAQVINWYYGDKQRLADVEGLALEDEVILSITEKCKVKEVNMTFDELMNKGQTDGN